MKRACRPVIVSIEEAGALFRIWGCNDTLFPMKGKMSLWVHAWSGPPRWERVVCVSLPANTSGVVAEILKADLPSLGLDAVLVADLKAGKQGDRAWYFAGLPCRMRPPAVELTVRREARKGKREAVIIKADSYARVVTLEADVAFSDNYFDLLPGEERRIEWIGKLSEADPLLIRCWNGRTAVRIS